MAERPPIPRYGTPNFDYVAKLAAVPPEEDGPIYMVNLMKYRQVASYADGNPSGRSGREADDDYAPVEILRDIGAEIVFVGDVERQLIGTPAWDRIGVVRYPTRRAFLDMQRRRDFKEKHVHKDAGMEQTIVMGCIPRTRDLPGGSRDNPGEDSFVMLHVMRFAPGGRERMAEYEATAGAAGLARGVRPEAVLKVEGTVIGDGREWDEVRFNRFPSREVFQDLVSDPVHQAAQAGRASALTDTYAMMVTATRDVWDRELGR